MAGDAVANWGRVRVFDAYRNDLTAVSPRAGSWAGLRSGLGLQLGTVGTAAARYGSSLRRASILRHPGVGRRVAGTPDRDDLSGGPCGTASVIVDGAVVLHASAPGRGRDPASRR